MNKTRRCLSDTLFARFLVAIEQNEVSVELPGRDFDIRNFPYYIAPATVYAGGVRAVEFANDVKALVEERDALKDELSRCKDSGRAKVKCIGGKVTTSRSGVVKIKGGDVEISGPIQITEVA